MSCQGAVSARASSATGVSGAAAVVIAGGNGANNQTEGLSEQIRPVRARVARAIEDVVRRAGSPDPATIARRIERSAFNSAVTASGTNGAQTEWGSRRFATKYEQYSVYCIRNAARMAELVESGAETARNIASCSSQFLRPEVWDALVAEKTVRDQCTDDKASVVKANTTALSCGRCKSKECYFYEMQTRSADEPMTVFITCLDCGHRWRTG